MGLLLGDVMVRLEVFVIDAKQLAFISFLLLTAARERRRSSCTYLDCNAPNTQRQA